MPTLLTYLLAWLLNRHVGLCAGCDQLAVVLPSLDRTGLLCRRCDRRSFGSVPHGGGRVR